MRNLILLSFLFFSGTALAHDGECVEEGKVTSQALALLSGLKDKFSKQLVSKEFCKEIRECHGNLMNVSEEMCENGSSSWAFKESGVCGLTRQEYLGLSQYIDSLYKCINPVLYSDSGEDFKLLTDTINSALDKFPRYEGFVFRGASLPKNVLDLHKEGAIVDYKAFTSTSTNPRIGEAFGNGGQMFLIYSKTGKPIMGLVKDAYENEVLFKTGTKFKVLKVKSKQYIMREFVQGETQAEGELEDVRVLELARKANKKSASIKPDAWSCPVDPHNLPEVLNQKYIPDTSKFLE